jgi:DNA-binding CsgD family transcriptional regulator
MPSAGSGLATPWPLVGRESELAAIREALAAGATGVLIRGGFGTGKTRLAKKALEEAELRGNCVLWVRATRSASEIPFGAFGALISEAGSCVAESVQDLVRIVREIADGRDVLLGIDDAQLLDPASAAFVLQSAERGVLSTVATVRAGEPCPDAVTALWKDAGSIRIELGVMSESEVVQLVETVLEAPLQYGAQRWIATSAKGNVLFAQQLVQGAIDDRALTLSDGSWHLDRVPQNSESLRELTTARMGALDETERAALELLALGEPLAFEEASRLLDVDTLAALESHHLIVVAGAGAQAPRVELAHPLYAEAILAECPVLRGRSHRVRLAEVISARADPRPADAVRRALWLTEAGETVPAYVLLDAARAANPAGTELGAGFAQRALDAGAGPEATMLLAAAQYVHGRSGEAEAALSLIEGTIEDRTLALKYLRERGSILHYGLGRTGEAVALLDRAEGWWGDADWGAQVAILRLLFQALAGPPGEAAPEIEALLQHAELPGDARRSLRAVLAADRLREGRVEEAYALLAEIPSFPLLDELDFLELATRCVVCLAAGTELAALDTEMAAAFTRAADAADHAAAGQVAITVARTRYLSGAFLDAHRWLKEALAEAARQDPLGTRSLAQALQAGISLALGEEPSAPEAADAPPQDESAGDRPGDAAWVLRGRAWRLLARGEATRAQDLLVASAADPSRTPVQSAELLYEAMRAGRGANELAPALAELAERCDGPLTRACASHVQARARGDARAMLSACERFAELGACLFAVEAAAHAAAAFAAEGRQDSARRAAARSRELQPEGQGAEPPSIEGVDRATTELTPREAEMVEFAARGMTNAEIAQTLVISTRTVETHIYRAMRKLGITDRREFRSQILRSSG